MELDRKAHWNNVYTSKKLDEVSWYQPVPTASLDLVKEFNIPKNAKIIDIGGGDSLFVDFLIAEGYTDITVLDISEAAIGKAKLRLGEKAMNIKWIVSDVLDFNTLEKYDFWHDRATFHFLNNRADINQYLEIVKKAINKNGIVTIASFSTEGPKKCSGIDIIQYSENSLIKLFGSFLKKVRCFTVDHKTPFNTIQNFIFCSFKN